MKLPIPFACLCMLSVSVCFQAVAIDSASQNTSLVKADMTCQRIVLANRSDKHSNFSNTVGFVDTSYADIDDDLLGKGAQAFDLSIGLGTIYRDRLQINISTGYEAYEWDGDAFSLDGNFLQAAAMYAVTNTFSVGPFVEVAAVEVGHDASSTEDQDTLWATGLLATQIWMAGNYQIGLTGTLASMNKSSFSEVFDKTDSAFAALLDVYRPLTDSLGITGYTYYYSLLGSDVTRDTDGHYWLFGVELDQQLTESLAATLGFSTITANRDYNEDRITLGVRYVF